MPQNSGENGIELHSMTLVTNAKESSSIDWTQTQKKFEDWVDDGYEELNRMQEALEPQQCGNDDARSL
ncbi:unnamed protein product [Angiostrongylus costaricensis]|uniref:Uncharacterized protein n=1 Tax=Angiostrongylus costaricensis TaxID=334426 RepID=A0A0R3PZX3_ANGCS|nr:unnamed protein product [Angiostrongylus costaricensis]